MSKADRGQEVSEDTKSSEKRELQADINECVDNTV